MAARYPQGLRVPERNPTGNTLLLPSGAREKPDVDGVHRALAHEFDDLVDIALFSAEERFLGVAPRGAASPERREVLAQLASAGGLTTVSDIDADRRLYVMSGIFTREPEPVGFMIARFDAHAPLTMVGQAVEPSGARSYLVRRRAHRNRIVFLTPPLPDAPRWVGQGADYEATAAALAGEQGMAEVESFSPSPVLAWWAPIELNPARTEDGKSLRWGLVVEVATDALHVPRWRTWL